MKQPTIEIEALTIGYKNKKKKSVIASQINASIFAGELTTLIGPNGVGKSTLLRTLSKLQPKYSGSVRLYGTDLQEIKEDKLAILLSVVLTGYPVIYNITASEMIAMGRSPYTNYWGTLSTQDKQIITEAIDMVGIKDLKNRIFTTLSDGEKQKVMIAKALAQQTPIILLDEPTSFLDYPSKIELMQLLLRLTQEMNKTILFSTHDLDLALQVCDKMALMSYDKMIIGTPEDLAITNQLSQFLTAKGMMFDEQQGLFKVKHHLKWAINLKGSGVIYYMVQKALLRKRVLSNKEVNSKSFLIVEGKDIMFHLDSGKILKVDTIEELLTLPELKLEVIPLSE